MNDHERLDLSALDPTADPIRFERLVAETMRRAQPELERRVTPPYARLLAGWYRPTLAAAGLAAVVSAAVLTLASPQRSAEAAPEPIAFSALLDDWVLEARMPSAADVMLVLEGDLP